MEFIEEKLCNIYDIGSGISITPDKYGYGYPFLTFKDIFNSPYIKDEIETLVDSTERDRKNSSICKGDVFLTRTSETAEELGMSTVALKDYPNATFNGFSKRLRPKKTKIDPLYAAYYFRTHYFRSQTYAMASIITRASLNNTNISHLKIRYPKQIEDQHMLGKILYNYDLLIENNNKRIGLLEKMAEKLYKEWFVRFRFPGYKNAKFIRGIPVGWEVVKLGEKVCIKGGKRLPKGHELVSEKTNHSYIRIRDISSKILEIDDGYLFVEDETFDKISRYITNKNDILISIVGTIGSVAFVGETLNGANLTENCVKLKAQNTYEQIFIHEYLQSELGQGMLKAGIVGSTQPKLPIYNIDRIKLLYPDIEVINKFSGIIQPIYEEISILCRENRKLNNQKNLLLPRLMSGKLDVK